MHRTLQNLFPRKFRWTWLPVDYTLPLFSWYFWFCFLFLTRHRRKSLLMLSCLSVAFPSILHFCRASRALCIPFIKILINGGAFFIHSLGLLPGKDSLFPLQIYFIPISVYLCPPDVRISSLFSVTLLCINGQHFPLQHVSFMNNLQTWCCLCLADTPSCLYQQRSSLLHPSLIPQCFSIFLSTQLNSGLLKKSMSVWSSGCLWTYWQSLTR